MELRPYQENSKQLLREGFRAGHTRQVLVAATGSGKSITMLSMIQNAIEKGSRVLFICERRILVSQFSLHLDRAGIDHGIFMAGTWRFRPQELVQVASAQTLEKMEAIPAFDIVFIDEVHACMRKSIVNLIKTRPHMKIVGATATPFNPKLSEHFSNVVNVISMKDLIDEGHLVPFRVFAAREVDTAGLKVISTGEWEQKKLEERGKQITGDIVADYIRLTNEVFHEQRKGICFSCGVAHGAELVQKFNESGVMAVQISHKDTDEYKAEVLAEFKKPDTELKIVISSEILERGFDQSDIYFVILAKPIKKSFSKLVQMVGRGARPHPDKSFVVIQDHGNNWLRFSEEWETLFNDGVKELTSTPDTTQKKEPTELEKKRAKCPKCGALWPGNSDVCAHCGMVRVRHNNVVAVAGEMLELTGQTIKKEKFTGEYKEAFFQGLLGYAKSKGYKDGWAFHAYIEKFQVQPSWKKQKAVPSPEVMGWITHRNIKNAKRRAA